jgi:hypothetical protein
VDEARLGHGKASLETRSYGIERSADGFRATCGALTVPSVRIVWAVVSLVALGFLSGCGGGTPASESTAVPPPPIERDLPKGYRVLKTFDANLTGASVPEKVVTAVGPPTSHNGAVPLTPATVQVLTWDKDRWRLIFDAQKTQSPQTYGDPRTSNGGPGRYPGVGDDPKPLIDPEAEVTLGTVDAAPLLTEKRDELVFSAMLNYGGSGVPQILAVVDFDRAEPKVVYAWSGEHLELKLGGDRIFATSSVWARGDAHCCPTRDYRFVVGRSGSRITELQDQRPYLGVLVREKGEYFGEGPYQVIAVTKGAPAAGKLQVGDVLLGFPNAKTGFYQQLASLDAGASTLIGIRRNGTKMTISVKLGSAKDAAPVQLPEGEDRFEAL